MMGMFYKERVSFQFCEMLASGAKRYWHKEHQVPYLVQGDQFWSYDDEESTLIKVRYKDAILSLRGLAFF